MAFDEALHYVAALLLDYQDSQPTPDKVDAVLRTGFNRCYYASFVCARQLVLTLRCIPPDDLKLSHAAYPEFFEKTIKNAISRHLKQSLKTHLITPQNYTRMNADLSSSTKSVSATLRDAYDVRVVADYRPERLVENLGSPVLCGVPAKDARRWRGQVSSDCSRIRRTWEACGSQPI